MDLRTTYLGLTLKNPLVPSASPLSRSLDMAKKLEDAGASALVMYSLFEEELQHDQEVMDDYLNHQTLGHAEAASFLPLHGDLPSRQESYLEQLTRLKQALEIPVIASLNGITPGGWIEHGKALQQAGADALELNVYYIAGDSRISGVEVERRYIDLLHELRQHVTLPIAMKLSPQFSSVANIISHLERVGANGVSLFNRFYQPDIDIDSLRVTPQLSLSSSADALLAMRWIAMLYGRVKLSLAATGGVHNHEDAVKMLLAGADVVHLCSTLLIHGTGRLAEILRGIEDWLEESPYESIEQLKGTLSQQHAGDASAYARANYLQLLNSYLPAGGG
ncbi:dihydroorotate dehydrogenase-like protein [Sedimenticola selenatireducens]|uniref:Dihydroorotate dehydrogenase n=1 Tax=Sedimenticola selenatireducens TaxID=191960 RepID=A0A2N6CWC4_9GAMM|nr:dihydroorotate dehydrogenase-like protein [Sedimenticola selenatireducens]PLX61554.1 MAG: dihydroorotate dehydrogenase [Sedimenticola selenatireducens]